MRCSKLQANQLVKFLSNLHDFFVGVPTQVRDTEREIISWINTARSHGGHNSEPGEVRNMAETVGDWLLEYFQCVAFLHLTISIDTCASDIALSLSKSYPCGIYGIVVLAPSPPRYDRQSLFFILPDLFNS